MCTAITYKTQKHYFGRNLDLEYSYHETVTITPRNYPFKFRKMGTVEKHYAMIGMAYVVENYPLYYDATNEKGLSMAGLNFPGNADYKQYCEDKDNISPFEFIPWILGQCADLKEVRVLLGKINLWRENFSEQLPLSSLHWMISDRSGSITVECVKDGLKVYENPIEVLTNNPTFDMQLMNLNNYMHLSAKDPENCFSKELCLSHYSRGMGALGLPGDVSSMSRFVRASFLRMNSVSGESEEESVSQFFHILGAVEMPKGCVCIEDGVYDITIYSSCCNMDEGIYYFKTYDNSRITGVDMHKENLGGTDLICYPLLKEQDIRILN